MAFRSTHQKPSYRPDIDGLRAVAVLAVVFYHAGIPGFSGGFVGVDIFFVISGFLITGIVWSELQEGTFTLQDFYIRRMKRIFPALFALLAVSALAAGALLIPAELTNFGESLKATLLFYSNFYWFKHTDYFDAPAIDNPLLHTWSLAVEEQFYAFWPLILLLLSRRGSIKTTIYAILGLSLISLVYAETVLTNYPKEAFFHPWGRIWELLIGAALAVSPAVLRPGRLSTILAATGFAAIALAVSLYDLTTPFPGLSALLPCCGAALIVAAGNPSNPLSRILGAEPMRRIGLISYSLYLIHWPLFSFARLYLTEELPLALRLALVAASVFLAYGSWRWIETPFRRAQLPKLRVLGTAAAAMSCLFVAGFLFTASGGLPSRLGGTVLRVQPQGWDLPGHCRDLKLFKMNRNKGCELGEDSSAPYDFVLWGDSHARHFAPAIVELAKARKLSGVLFSRAGCHPFLDDPHTATACREFNAAAARWVEEHPVKLVILAGQWLSQRRQLKSYVEDRGPADNSGGLAKTLEFLAGKGMLVSVLDQVPEFPVDIASCISRREYFGRDFRSCATQPAAFYESRHRLLSDYFAFLQKQYSFSLASANQLICNSEECRAYDGETLYMVDGYHLTEPGALGAVPYLKIPLLSGPAGAERSAAIAGAAPFSPVAAAARP